MYNLKKTLCICLTTLIILFSFPLSSFSVLAQEINNSTTHSTSEPLEATEIIVANDIKKIENNAYKDNCKLESITIPNSVTEIGENAFSGCENLKEINYEGTRADFAKITIADGNENIRGTEINYTYSSPSVGLKFEWKTASSSYGDNYRGYFITGIGTCTDTEIILPETYRGESVIGIDQCAFEGNEDITGVYIPSCIRYINKFAFRNCTNLVWAELHSTINDDYELAQRGYGIFNGCSSLEFLYTNETEITSSTVNGYPDKFPIGFLFGSVSYENSTACTQYYRDFNTATSKSVTYYFPNKLKTIQLGYTEAEYISPFSGCKTIEKIIFSGSIDSVSYCESLKEVVFLKNITTIDGFMGCSNLEKIDIPSSVKTISSYAFYKCSSLKTVQIKSDSQLEKIYQKAFEGCTNLLSFNIPSSLKEIDVSAFTGCNSIKKVGVPSVKDWLEISFGDKDSNPASICGKIYIGDKLLTDIIVPESVTEISAYAFYNYQPLQSVIMHDNVVKIRKLT